MSRPKVKKASPRSFKKLLGVQADRVIDVVNDHAGCLEGLIRQVQYLTVQNQQKTDQIDALLDGMAQVQAKVNPSPEKPPRLVGPNGQRIM